MTSANETGLLKKQARAAKWKSYVFPTVMLAYPVVQVLIFYFGVNINSLLLAFKLYDDAGGYTWAGFENFRTVFYELFHDPTFSAGIRNSLITLAVSVFITTPLSTLFSYYVYKRYRGAEFFKVMLVLPMITSTLVMVLTFTGFVDRFLPQFMEKHFGVNMVNLVSNTNTQLYVLLFYAVLVGFGSSSLLYLGAMNGISPEMIEAGKMDGVTPFREFIHLVVPSIYGTFGTLIIVAVAGVFTNQLNLYSFFGTGAQPQNSTIGYYLYTQTQAASVAGYPRLATMGIIFTLIVAPVTLLVRYIINKFDPMGE